MLRFPLFQNYKVGKSISHITHIKYIYNSKSNGDNNNSWVIDGNQKSLSIKNNVPITYYRFFLNWSYRSKLVHAIAYQLICLHLSHWSERNWKKSFKKSQKPRIFACFWGQVHVVRDWYVGFLCRDFWFPSSCYGTRMMCKLLPLWLKLFSHCVHLYGFSKVCLRMWIVRFPNVWGLHIEIQ